MVEVGRQGILSQEGKACYGRSKTRFSKFLVAGLCCMVKGARCDMGMQRFTLYVWHVLYMQARGFWGESNIIDHCKIARHCLG
jgi:hypothetical protein